MNPRRLLILGGTTEGRALAEALAAAPRWQVTTSLAGRVSAPRLPPGAYRAGGFGGADGLADWLRRHGVAAVVDATHPFAARITANATAACAATGVPLLVVQRPGWVAGPGDRWYRVPSLAAAAARVADWAARGVPGRPRPPVPAAGGAAVALPAPTAGGGAVALPAAAAGGAGGALPVPAAGGGAAGAAAPVGAGRPLRVLLATGRQSVPAFVGCRGVRFLARMVDPPVAPLPAGWEVLLSRGPFTLDGERALLLRARVDAVVSKDSGGGATVAKLVAARERDLPVVLVDRPPLPPGVRAVPTAADALRWLSTLA